MKDHLPGAYGMLLLLAITVSSASAACENCGLFSTARTWGVVSVPALTEASGIVASRRNPGVLWVHNDGARERIFAVATNGLLLATCNLNRPVEDVEDIAVGPGPGPGVSYLYVGDIGASASPDAERRQVRIVRVQEPKVELSWASSPRSVAIESSAEIVLNYPDGAYDAETIMVDPLSTNLYIATKQQSGARLYRANVAAAADGAAMSLTFERSVAFSDASGGDISDEGRRIVLRRENYAAIWTRCEGESVGTALGRPGLSVPVVGPPEEPNGEGIALLPNGAGYVTISEGADPVLYFFQSSCPMAPKFTLGLTNQTAFVGATVEMVSAAAGYPAPVYSWRVNGQPLSGQTSNSLILTGTSVAQAGSYEITASNASGSAISFATLTVNPKPDLRITEVQSSTAPSPNLPTADWWELTSYESRPVDLGSWRFNDNAGGLTDPFRFALGLIIAPGETMVFVEGLTPLQFRAWWGTTNLPENLLIVTYSGAGLSLGAAGDGIRLWNNTATDPADTIRKVDFGAAANGVTFNYNPVTGEFGSQSQVGVNGVFKAASSSDIGSPGRIRAPAIRPTLVIQWTGVQLSIGFYAEAGRVYTLESTSSLANPDWSTTGQVLHPAANGAVSFSTVAGEGRAWYRVEVR